MFSPAFMGWAHEEELIKIADEILQGKSSICVRDDLSRGDLQYIKDRLKEAGYEVELTLD